MKPYKINILKHKTKTLESLKSLSMNSNETDSFSSEIDDQAEQDFLKPLSKLSA